MAEGDSEAGLIAANPSEGRPYQRGSRRSGGGGGRGSSVLVSVALVAALVAVAGGAYFLVTQHEELRTTKSTLEQASRRIAALEERLRLTDESLSASEEGTTEQINFWESEIRKLWDVSNKRNKNWIEDNQAALARLDKNVGAALADMDTVKSAVSRHETAISRQQDIADRLTAIDLQMNRLVANNRDLVDKANIAAGLATRLEQRVGKNEEAVAATDRWRASTNTRILNLESGRRGASPAQPASPNIDL